MPGVLGGLEETMKHLRRFTALALAAVTVLSLGGRAGAAPSTDSQSPKADASAAVSLVLNDRDSLVGLGVMRFWDGVYDRGLYDDVLPQGWSTDLLQRWTETEGIYIGPGYCALLSYWDGNEWRYGTAHPPGQWRISQTVQGQSVAQWRVSIVYEWRCPTLPTSG